MNYPLAVAAAVLAIEHQWAMVVVWYLVKISSDCRSQLSSICVSAIAPSTIGYISSSGDIRNSSSSLDSGRGSSSSGSESSSFTSTTGNSANNNINSNNNNNNKVSNFHLTSFIWICSSLITSVFGNIGTGTARNTQWSFVMWIGHYILVLSMCDFTWKRSRASSCSQSGSSFNSSRKLKIAT